MIRQIYDIFRPFLPRKIQMVNTVGVRRGRLFDRQDVFHDYEHHLVSHIRRHVTPNDDSVVVGGGIGVSSVVAARQSQPNGSVFTYEASIEQLDILSDTVELNNVANTITYRHAAVGEPKELLGEAGDFGVVDPEELPDADVFVLDCEGSELEILQSAELPDTIIVETHGELGSSSLEVERLLEQTHEKVDQDVMKPEEDVEVMTFER